MKSKFSIIIPLIVLLVVYFQWWLPGPRVANDYSLISKSSLLTQFELPQTWSVKGTEGLGEYTIFTLWSYPFSLLNGVFAQMGFSFELLERVLIMIPLLIIGLIGVWRLLEYLKLSSVSRVVASIFYLTNTYLILLVDGGQLTIAIAYSLFPITYLVIEESLTGGFKKRIIASLLICAIGFLDLRFIFILALLCLARFLFELLFFNNKQRLMWIKSWFKFVFIAALIYVGFNCYWLLAIFRAPLSQNTFTQLTQTSFISFISFGHSFFLLSPHWYKNVFGNITSLRFEFFLIPVLVFLAPILRRKDKIVAFWILIALISIFLTKGSSEPLSNIYPWLYSNIPGFSLFRDSSKFFFLVALSYTVLFAVTVDELVKRFKKFNLIIMFSLLGYLIFLIKPVWMGEMTGTFSNPPMQKDYSMLNNFLTKNSNSNIFWIPTITPLTSLDSSHPSLEASRLVQKRPFAQASIGTYEIFNFLREAPYMGQLFDISNIGYIVYPPLDPRRDNMKPENVMYYQTFLDQLSNLPWLTRVKDSEIPLLKVSQHQDKLFISPNVWWVVGSDDIYKESTKSSELALSKNALIFAEETPELGRKIDELPQAKIILNNKTSLDLAAGFLNINNLIFPAKVLEHDPDTSGWWKREGANLISWKDFLKSKYSINNQDFDLGGGWAIAEGDLELKINNPTSGDNVLLARVLESTRSGEINFFQNDKIIGHINTKKAADNVRWFEVGNLNSRGVITIKTQGDINVVNALAVVPDNLWQEYKDKAQSYQVRITSFGKENMESTTSVSYKQISATKYIVTVKNLMKPSMLIFSQNFDNNWKLNGESPLPVYSLLNGYSIKQDGDYELNFEPQKYILLGLIISLITLLASILLLLV